MQRKTGLLVTAMLLALAAAAAAQSTDQNQSYPQGSDAAVNQQQTTPAQAPATQTDPQTPATDPSTTNTSSQLPKTASPLPLVGLGGLVSLAAGARMTRTRRRA